jgi:hypothetical protein
MSDYPDDLAQSFSSRNVMKAEFLETQLPL